MTRDDEDSVWKITEVTTHAGDPDRASSAATEVPTNDARFEFDLESSHDVRAKRLDRNNARKLVTTIRMEGTISFTDHCRKALADDEMTTVDAVNILRCGKIEREPEFNGEFSAWRYLIETERMAVVVEFISRAECRAITAWRKRP